jgi:hypothetical protein
MPVPDPQRAVGGAPEDDMTMAELIDRGMRRLAASIVLASIIGGLSFYWRPGPPRYEAVAVGGQVVRVDTKTGGMISCDGVKCVSLHRTGQKVERRSSARSLLAPPAAPAPAAAPAAPAAPAASR